MVVRVLPWSLRLGAVLLMFFGVLTTVGMVTAAYTITAQPDGPGGHLEIELWNDEANRTVAVEHAGGTTDCPLTGVHPFRTCALDLEYAKGRIVLAGNGTDVMRDYYIIQGTDETWRYDGSAFHGPLGPEPKDVGPFVLAAALGILAAVGGLRLWMAKGWRIPMAGGMAVGLLSIVLMQLGGILVAGLVLWVVFKHRPQLAGEQDWVQRWAHDGPAGDEEE